jgi:hypothetical protein
VVGGEVEEAEKKKLRKEGLLYYSFFHVMPGTLDGRKSRLIVFIYACFGGWCFGQVGSGSG